MKYFFSVLLMGYLLSACTPSTSDEKSETGKSENAKTVSLSIKGMVCNGCAESITEALNESPGVINGKVTLNDSTAVVTFDTTVTNTGTLLSVVEKTGYTAVPQQ